MTFKPITSLQNPRVKDVVHLRSARQRNKQGRFLIDGARELSRAMQAGIVLVEAFVCPAQCTSAEGQAVCQQLLRGTAPVWEVPPEVFEKLSYGERHDGVLAVAATPQKTLAELQPVGDGPIAVVESLEKPGNVGAVLRSADGAGVSAVIVADAGTDLFNPNCIRASLGTVFSLPVAVASAAETLAWLRARGVRMFAARPDAQHDYTQCDLRSPVALVLGSEAQGLSSVWQADDVTALRLPMLGAADSLNVSAASAVLFYEAWRQRTAAKR